MRTDIALHVTLDMNVLLPVALKVFSMAFKVHIVSAQLNEIVIKFQNYRLSIRDFTC